MDKFNFNQINQNRIATVKLHNQGVDLNILKSELEKSSKEEKAMGTGNTPGAKETLECSYDEVHKAQDEETQKKMTKVMKEWKEGTLKTPAGKKVTDQKQAEAIAYSEAKAKMSDKSVEKAIVAGSTTGTETKNKSTAIEGLKKEDVEGKKNQLRKDDSAGGQQQQQQAASGGAGYSDMDKSKKKESIKKSFATLGLEYAEKAESDLLEKGGEGSKGGKVIGHTKSGHPIYDRAHHPGHSKFTPKEHDAAHDLHLTLASGIVAGRKFLTKEHEATEVRGHHEEATKHADEATRKNSKYKEREGSFTSKESRKYKTKVFESEADANDFMEDHPEHGVIGEDKEGVHVAHNDDKGIKVTTHKGHRIETHETPHGDPKVKTTLKTSHIFREGDETNTPLGSTASTEEKESSEDKAKKRIDDHLTGKTKDLRNPDLHKAMINDAFSVLGLEVLEKAEGSRGGKVTGHTKSGKPIYSQKEDYAHHAAHAAYHSQSPHGSKELRGKHLDAMDKLAGNMSERDKKEAEGMADKMQPKHGDKISKFIPYKPKE